MKNEFIPYEEALALKELGFDEDVCGYFGKGNKLFIVTPEYNDVIKLLKAPTYSQAFRWFREEHGLVKQDYLFFKKNVRNAFNISKDDGENLYDSCYNSNDEEIGDGFSTYEEVEFVCLRKLIEIVNQMKDEHK